MVVNDVSAPGVGFDHDTNAVTILGPTAAGRWPSPRRAVADAVLIAWSTTSRSTAGPGTRTAGSETSETEDLDVTT